MLNSHPSFKISLPFHTKATTWDFPRHPLFTPRHFQVERENLSIYLGFPGVRQSGARAASDRLTSLEAQKEHSEQLHVQGVPVQRAAHPSCAGVTAHVLQPCSRPQEHKSELSSLWNVQDKATTLTPATAWTHWPSIHSVVWNTGAIGTLLELGEIMTPGMFPNMSPFVPSQAPVFCITSW